MSRGEDLPETIGSALEPEFCEWLMGYPTGWTGEEWERRKRIEALGDSVVPAMAEHIGRYLK